MPPSPRPAPKAKPWSVIHGLDVARRIRVERRELAILMLTARDTVSDRVAGLDAGADDYLVKPFAYEELAARLRALARRTEGTGAARRAEARRRPDRPRRSRPHGDGRRPADRSQPARVLAARVLLRHPGQALSRDQLLDQAWPFGVAVTPNAVDAYVHYLRTKLGSEGDRIETVRGVGYRLNDA